MMKREGRKAATQALVVIAESIRASRGRRSNKELKELQDLKDIKMSQRSSQEVKKQKGVSNKENVKPKGNPKHRKGSMEEFNSKSAPQEEFKDLKLTRQMSRIKSEILPNSQLSDYNNKEATMINGLTSTIQAADETRHQIPDLDFATPENIVKGSGRRGRKPRATPLSQSSEFLDLKKSASMVNPESASLLMPQDKKDDLKLISQQTYPGLSILPQIFENQQITPQSNKHLQTQNNNLIINQLQTMNTQEDRESPILMAEDFDDDESESNLMSQSVTGGNGVGGLSGSQGRWTQEEHDKFIEGLKLFGKDWKRIEEYIGTRSCAQIRSHAQKYFNRLQRDIARGIKRSDEVQASMVLGKKKRRHVSTDFKEASSSQRQKTDLEPYLKTPVSFKDATSIFPLTSTSGQKDMRKPQPLSNQTNLQIQQIHETLSKISDDDISLQMKQLIAQREQLSLEVLLNKLTKEKACELLVQITHKLHTLAMQALQTGKFDVCNRMIDERNLTQFVCILLSKQITIAPFEILPSQSKVRLEIVQHVDILPDNYASK